MGGAAGHLSHLHEDLAITFGDIKSVLQNVAEANIEVYEKVDGQNILFTYHSPSATIKTARNTGDLKRGGMSPEEFSAKWKGHPAEKAFINGFKAISSAISKIPEKQLLEIFGENGENFVNAEIMYVGNPNIVQYGSNWVVLHGMSGPTKTGGGFKTLVQLISNAEEIIDNDNWAISGPQITQLNNLSKDKHFEIFANKLDSINSLGDSATIGDFVENELRTSALKGIDISKQKKEDLINIILSKENAKRLIDVKKGLPKDTQKQLSAIATKQNRYKLISKLVSPIENAINDFAIEVLRGLQSFFAAEHKSEVTRMRQELQSAINNLQQVKGSDSETVSLMLDKQLAKLGKIENVASTLEGIVFEYPVGSKKLYKLTGAFAMANQIIGKSRRLQKEHTPSKILLQNYIKYLI
jgi:hypothetical protein